jgi:hypothetical protein
LGVLKEKYFFFANPVFESFGCGLADFEIFSRLRRGFQKKITPVVQAKKNYM